MKKVEKTIEERLLSIERRFNALCNTLSEEAKSEIELETRRMIMEDDDAKWYEVEFIIDSDRGSVQYPPMKIKAWSGAQAMYLAHQDFIYPMYSKAKDNGKIQWFKTTHKKFKECDS